MVQAFFMIYLIFAIMTSIGDPIVLFDFNSQSDLSGWMIVDDVVMGGRSNSYLVITEEGQGRFHGAVSLENYGGFASTRYRPRPVSLAGQTTCKIQLKGDGKVYQFRIKEYEDERFSYVYSFETSGEWEVVEIPLAEMYPSFRGRILDMPYYQARQVSEVAILISNKRNEKFELIIDNIIVD